jgi:hypothetical protein
MTRVARGGTHVKDAVLLSESERAHLRILVGRGTAPARTLTHARILLKANRGRADRAGQMRRWPGR